jgi:Cys-rich protein (TIGR01571 family)
MKLLQLKERALALSVDSATLDRAEEGERPKEQFIQLIIEATPLKPDVKAEYIASLFEAFDTDDSGLMNEEEWQVLYRMTLASAEQAEGALQPWATPLFACCAEPVPCLLTTACPCVVHGNIAQFAAPISAGTDADDSRCLTYSLVYGLCAAVGGVAWLGCWMRGRVRERLGIAGSPIQDWWIHCLCPLCAMCQEYNTLTQRTNDFNLASTLNATRDGVRRAQELSHNPTPDMSRGGEGGEQPNDAAQVAGGHGVQRDEFDAPGSPAERTAATRSGGQPPDLPKRPQTAPTLF